MVNLKVDNGKCPNAFDCLKCLNVCRSGALLALPAGNPWYEGVKGRIEPTLISLCTGCGDCQRACSVGAITFN